MRFPLTAWQKSLAEFAARRRRKNSNHFLPGRVPGRKYFSGCKCGICPQNCGQIMRAADCRPFVKKARRDFLTVSEGEALMRFPLKIYLQTSVMVPPPTTRSS